jgi:hypothetical protein
MKCQNCGKNEVSLHYSANINGQVTQAFLCRDCAEELGCSFGESFGAGSFFDGLFPAFGSFFGPRATGIPGYRAVPAYPWALPVGPDRPVMAGDWTCGNVKCAPDGQGAQIDEEMKKRREINMLKEQMRLAAEKDEFEEAIKLREKIKGMEDGTGP